MTEADRYLEEKLKRDAEAASALKQAGRVETTAVAGHPPDAVIHSGAATGAVTVDDPIAARPSSISAKAGWFTVEGRLNRMGYFLRMLILLPVGFAGYVLIDHFLVFGFSLSLVVSAIVFLQAAKRLHDLNQSGWLAILFLIPIANIVVGLLLLFVPGKDGPNRFGLQPA